MGDPAPLLGIAGAPSPGAGYAEWFRGVGDVRLRAALFPALVSEPRGSVIVSPGRTEPIEKYFEVVEDLRRRGFTVLVHDWRGQGLSHRLLADRRLGHAAGAADFLNDYRILLDVFAARLPTPWIAMGHSMGGCLTLLALARGERRFSAAILSAPMLGLKTGAIPLSVGRLLGAAARRVGMGGRPFQSGGSDDAPFEANMLTHDRARYERAAAQVAANPDLGLGSPTWGWIDFAFSATVELQTGPGVMAITAPVTVVAAGEDRLVDNVAAKRVAARMPKGRFIEIAGAYHEILQETDAMRAAFWTAFDALIGENQAGVV